MKFVDRKEEIGRLDRLARADHDGGGLAVVWGRRRCGKTRLLVEWCGRHHGLYTVADPSAAPVQRRWIAQALGTVIDGFADVEYPDWRSLLAAVSRSGWRGPLVIDELPYLVAADPGIPGALQSWIDHDARRAGLVVVVAGSAQHMMGGLVLDSSAPLYGRAAEIMRLAPMSPSHLMEAMGIRDPVAGLAAHSVLGGIPRYWELALPFAPGAAGAGGFDLDAAVDALLLDPLGPLHEEPDRVLSAEIPAAHSLRPLLDVIGAGACRVSEIGGRLGQAATSLSRPLQRLCDLGLVLREQPFGEPERGTRRTLYRIGDPLLRAWFRVVGPRRGLLASARPAGRRALWAGHRPALLAEGFEDACRASTPRLEAGIPGGPFGPAGRLWEPGGREWDVAARSLDGRSLLLGEVKWHDSPVDARFADRAASALLSKGRPRSKALAGMEIVHALFVPALGAGASRRGLPLPVIEARDVVEAFRA